MGNYADGLMLFFFATISYALLSCAGKSSLNLCNRFKAFVLGGAINNLHSFRSSPLASSALLYNRGKDLV